MLFDFSQKPAPTGFSVTAKPLGNVAGWAAVDDSLHEFYRLYRYASAEDADNDADGEAVEETARLTVRDDAPLTAGHEYGYRVTSVDRFGNESAKSAVRTATARLVTDADLDIDSTLGSISTDIGAAVAAEAAARAAEIAAEAEARAAQDIATYQDLRAQAEVNAETASYVIELAMIASDAQQSLRREVVTQANSDRASFVEQISTAVSANAALASRVTTVEAETATLSASIETIELAYVAGDEALAQTIESLAVGTNTQFDPVASWYFDASADGWSGNGTPVVTDGYLVPAAHASDPYVVSPEGLTVAGGSYRQVRARAKKTGAPAWEGWLWWKGASDTTWDSGRRAAITEPAWDGAGFGEITVNTGWSGTIAQIRLDLTAAADASNLVALDWVSVGRPSPGASSAALTAEQTARIAADSAQAGQITSLTSRMTSAESGITGTAGGLSALTGRVETAEDAITAQAVRIDGVEASLDDKASVTAVDVLTAEVAAFGGEDGVASIGQATRTIRNELDLAASEAIEASVADFLAREELRQATATATQGLGTRIDATQTSLTVLSESVTSLSTAVAGKASTTAVETLTSRVTVTEGAIDALNESVTALDTEVDGKASASSVTALGNRVTVTESGITTLNSAVTALGTEVDGKASASSVTEIGNRVTVTESGITALNSSVTSLTTTVAGKASASSVTSLGNRVTETEDGLESVANATTSLFAGDDAGNIASARMRMAAVSGPSGWARFAIQVRAQSDDDWNSAGFFLDVRNDGSDSRIVQIADRFVFRNGDDVTSAVMRVASGVIYLNEVNISDAIIGTLQVGGANIADGVIKARHIDVTRLSALAATLGNVDISEADIGNLTVKNANIESLNGSKLVDLTVGTGKIENGAITEVDSIAQFSDLVQSNDNPAAKTITLANPSSSTVFIWLELPISLFVEAGGANGADTQGSMNANFSLIRNFGDSNAYALFSKSFSLLAQGGGNTDFATEYVRVLVADIAAPANASYRFKSTFTNLEGTKTGGVTSGRIRFGYPKK
ncbi:hypothetical protein M2360_000936 [Rhizobium sp. SG_E_25_P2]|uniref:hypothetical protein n=1 Tax=Rhizobium sp. SG_E_25_P2 TaxID=2879942 RepID=UPI002474A7CA|nr:hypothetical protein [Rhizobium sp. SG_E_25_P2]MDH6265546.1 hypothetical protein [Rhizobium sp. SG_E_25_P2]